MDPLTAACVFATIVQLIAIYKQEHKEDKDLDHQKFMEWLEYHRHEELKNIISTTAAIQSEVDVLLRQDHAAIMEKLDGIDTTLAALLSHVEGFSGLASVMVPSAKMSEQAISILKQLVKSSSKYFFRIRAMGGVEGYCLERGGHIKYQEPRFVEDDLNNLVVLGFLSIKYGTGGEPIYGVTRQAVRLIGLIDGANKESTSAG